jgi:hypothetical protein
MASTGSFTLKWGISVSRIGASRPVWVVEVPTEGFFAANEGARLVVLNVQNQEVAIHDEAQRWEYRRLALRTSPMAVLLSGLRLYSFGSHTCTAYDLRTGDVVLEREMKLGAVTKIGLKHAAIQVETSAHMLIDLRNLSMPVGQRMACDSYHFCRGHNRYIGVNWTEAERVDIVLFRIGRSLWNPIVSVPLPSPGLEEFVMFHDRRMYIESTKGKQRTIRVHPLSWTMVGEFASLLHRRLHPVAHGWKPVPGVACSIKPMLGQSSVLLSSLNRTGFETLDVANAVSQEGSVDAVNDSQQLRPTRPRIFIG